MQSRNASFNGQKIDQNILYHKLEGTGGLFITL